MGESLERGKMKVLPILSLISLTILLVSIHGVNGTEEEEQTLAEDYQSQNKGAVLHELPSIRPKRRRIRRPRRRRRCRRRRYKEQRGCEPGKDVNTFEECRCAARFFGHRFKPDWIGHPDEGACMYIYVGVPAQHGFPRRSYIEVSFNMKTGPMNNGFVKYPNVCRD